ncbi:MAG: response regulator [Anaerolineae bacterium]
MAAKTIDYSKFKVWVVEDDLPSWGLVSRLLEVIGITDFTVTIKVSTVFEAMEKGLGIDVLLIDVHLKDGSGYDLLHRVQNDPNYARTKCLMISASTGPKGIREAQAAHADGFISKPLTIDKGSPDFPQVFL